MPGTEADVLALQEASAEARHRLQERIRRSRIVRDNGNPPMLAWGQYLNLPDVDLVRPQHGLLGTSAALQILADGEPHDSEILRGADRYLPESGGIAGIHATTPEESEAHRRQFAKNDHQIVFKLAAILEATNPDHQTIPDTHWAVASLQAIQNPGSGGWSDYRGLDEDNPIATATALVALRRVESFRSSHGCKRAILFLLERVTSVSSASEVALAALSLSYYCREAEQAPERAKQLDRLYELVAEHLTNPVNDIATSLQYHEYYHVTDPSPDALNRTRRSRRTQTEVATPDSPGYEFKYMFYLPSLLCGLALLRRVATDVTKDLHIPERRAICEIAEHLQSYVLTHRAFAVSWRPRYSTVDQLWVHSFLKQFEGIPAHKLAFDRSWRTELGLLAKDIRRRLYLRRCLLIAGGFSAVAGAAYLAGNRGLASGMFGLGFTPLTINLLAVLLTRGDK